MNEIPTRRNKPPPAPPAQQPAKLTPKADAPQVQQAEQPAAPAPQQNRSKNFYKANPHLAPQPDAQPRRAQAPAADDPGPGPPEPQQRAGLTERQRSSANPWRALPQNFLTADLTAALDRQLEEALAGDPLDSPPGYVAKQTVGRQLRKALVELAAWAEEAFRRRRTDSLDWIRDDKKLPAALRRKGSRHLLGIMEFLIEHACGYNASLKAQETTGADHVKMVAQQQSEDEDGRKVKTRAQVKRVPVFVFAPPALIAAHCKISERTAERYLTAMVRAGLVQRGRKPKVKTPGGAPLIIGGFNVYRQRDKATGDLGPERQRPVYFWSSSHKSRIKPLLARFTVHPGGGGCQDPPNGGSKSCQTAGLTPKIRGAKG